MSEISQRLLDWYDVHGRTLPWRVRGRRRPDPYRVWLSEIMLQQTTVAAVVPYFEKFVAAWPTVAALARTELDAVLTAWAGLGYYSRARNLHACARLVVERHDGAFPRDVAALRALPGIGPYTAAAIAAIAFDARAAPVDGNVERVMARLHAVTIPLPKAKKRLTALAEACLPEARFGDHAQAMMDLGATVCTPRQPKCPVCPFADLCRARSAHSRISVAPGLAVWPRNCRRKRRRNPGPHGAAPRSGWKGPAAPSCFAAGRSGDCWAG